MWGADTSTSPEAVAPEPQRREANRRFDAKIGLARWLLSGGANHLQHWIRP
jgi:hypothetical protein